MVAPDECGTASKQRGRVVQQAAVSVFAGLEPCVLIATAPPRSIPWALAIRAVAAAARADLTAAPVLGEYARYYLSMGSSTGGTVGGFLPTLVSNLVRLDGAVAVPEGVTSSFAPH